MKPASEVAKEIVQLAVKDHDDGGWAEAGLNEILATRITAALQERDEKLAKAVAALELIAAPIRNDGTYNRCREACEQLARETLREVGG